MRRTTNETPSQQSFQTASTPKINLKPRRNRLARTLQLELLEDRRLLAVASVPDQSLPLGVSTQPVFLTSAHVYPGSPTDLTGVARDGYRCGSQCR